MLVLGSVNLVNLLNAHQFWGSIVRSRVLVDVFCYYLAGGGKKIGEFASTYHNKEPILDSDLYMGMDIWNISNHVFACFEFTY